MTENKTTMKDQAREKYEPMAFKVLTVTPQGILCQSGGGAGLTSYKRGI